LASWAVSISRSHSIRPCSPAATLEWVTPGHPLFESVRAAAFERVQDDLRRGAIFFDLHRSEPARLDVFSAAIMDGRSHVLNRRLFIVQTDLDGTLTVHQPTLLLDLTPAPEGIEPLQVDGLPGLDQVEQALVEQALVEFLGRVTAEREHEIGIIWRHMDLSLNELINRQNLRMGELLDLQVAGDTSQPLAANIAITQERLDELNARLERRRLELEREGYCTIADLQHHGRAWVMPHPERTNPNIAPMVRDDEIERIAVDAVIAYEEARGWRVQSVEKDNRGFDLISRKPHPPTLKLPSPSVLSRSRAGPEWATWP